MAGRQNGQAVRLWRCTVKRAVLAGAVAVAVVLVATRNRPLPERPKPRPATIPPRLPGGGGGGYARQLYDAQALNRRQAGERYLAEHPELRRN